MKVKMLVKTVYGGARLHEGNEVDVSREVAERWSKRGIAVIIDSNPADDDLNSLTARQLFDKCAEAGLNPEPKQSKDYYISLLEGKKEE